MEYKIFGFFICLDLKLWLEIGFYSWIIFLGCIIEKLYMLVLYFIELYWNGIWW